MSNHKTQLKQLPPLLTNEEDGKFTDEADLSGFKSVRFELRRKNKTVSLRLSDELLKEIKDTAVGEGIPYQRFIRDAIERALHSVKQHKKVEKVEG